MKNKDSSNPFKRLIAVLGLIAICFTAPLHAAWVDAYGFGDGGGSSFFSARGNTIGVVGSVISNTVYTIHGGPAAAGNPLVQSVFIKQDSVAGALEWWHATNTWTVASNGALATNIIWLTTTNTGMATNDLIVYQDSANSQLTLIGGGATSASGLFITNALGQCGVKVWNNVSNVVAGAKLYKMTRIQSLTPLTMQNVTNDTPAPFGNWFQVATRAAPKQFYGRLGYPSLLTMSYSNSADINVDGIFKRRND